MISLLLLSWEFFKTGLFAVGGGLATLPFLYDMSAKTGWFSLEDISNMVAISESTPGPLGINMATYVGYSSFSLPGALIAPLSLVIPSIVIIVIVAGILEKFKESKLVKDIFSGLRPASTAMIAAAGLSVAKIALLHLENCSGISALSDLSLASILDVLNIKAIILAIVVYVAIKKFNRHPIFYIMLSAVIGIVFKF